MIFICTIAEAQINIRMSLRYIIRLIFTFIMNNIYIYILIIIFFVSCNAHPHPSLEGFEIVKDLVVTDSIELEGYNILNPNSVYYTQNMLVFKSRGRNGLQVLDLNDYKSYVMNIIGVGPDEVSMFNIIRNKYSSVFHFVDPNTKKILEFRIDTLRDCEVARPFFLKKTPTDANEVVFNGFENSSFFFFTGHIGDGRFLSYNKKTGYKKVCGEFPENDQTVLLNERRKGSVFNGTMMTGNESHFVACCSGLIDFYEISPDGELHEITNRYYHFPNFEVNNGNGPVVSFSSEDKEGFRGIDSEGNFVYTLYSDKTFKEYRERAYNCETLFLYDWEGNPQCEYRLEKSLYSFAVNGKRIYGLSRENDPKVYVYELP